MIDFKGEDRDVLIYAFRYALGRSTYSTSTMSDLIAVNWPTLAKHDRELFQREIQEAIDMGYHGMEMDKQAWERVLKLDPYE